MKTKILTITILTTAWIAQAGATTPSDLIRSMHERVNTSVTHTHPMSHPQRRAVQEHSSHSTRLRTHHTARTTHRTQPRRSHHPKHHANRYAVAEKKLASQTPTRRRFRTLAEYQRIERHANRHASRKQAVRHARYATPSRGKHLTRQKRYVGNGWYVDEHGQYDEQYTESCTTEVVKRRHHRPQKAFRYYRRQWYLTYLWEHASFVDQYGYLYGTFDVRGFYFEGKYYRYDRSYTYQDRLHGKGLFEHRFYRPRQHRVRRNHTRREWAGTDRYDGEFYVEWTWRQ